MTKMTLAECPPGLFRFNGTLCFKSEYTTTLENPRRYQCDAYVVESGEYFHGGTAGNTLARSNLLVEPVSTPLPDSGERMREAAQRLVSLLDERCNGGFTWTPLMPGEPIRAALDDTRAALQKPAR